MLKAIKSYFTLKLIGSDFADVVSGKKVCTYVDCFGDYYLKDSRWAFFAIKKY